MTCTSRPLPITAGRRDKSAWLHILPLPLLELALVLAWSSGFVGVRYTIDHAPAFLVVFWRCVLVTMVLLPFVYNQLSQTPVAVLVHHAGIGLLAMAGYLAGVTQGIVLGVPAGAAALLADLLPIGMALLATVVLRQRQVWRVWVGLVIGLGGVLVVTRDALTWGDAPLWAYGLPVIGMLSLAVATLWRKQLKHADSLGLLANLAVQCGVSSIAFGAAAAWEGSLWPMRTEGFAIGVLWTAGISTMMGYGLYWLCLQRATPTRVASVLYLSPGVTMLWAWAMFDDALTITMLIGTAISAVGIWIVVRADIPTSVHQMQPRVRSPAPD